MLVQPSAWPRMIAEGDAEEPGGGEREAAEVERLVRAVGLGQHPARQRDQGKADGDVEPEDPLPGDSLDDRAADERAERDAEPADPAPDSQRGAAPLGREGLADEGQGQRGDDRRADSLQCPGCDQRVERRRQGGQQRWRR